MKHTAKIRDRIIPAAPRKYFIVIPPLGWGLTGYSILYEEMKTAVTCQREYVRMKEMPRGKGDKDERE